MQNAYVAMQVSGHDPQKLKRQTTHYHTLREPTPLKNKRWRNRFQILHQKEWWCSFIHTQLSTGALPGAQSRSGRTHEALGPVAAL